MGFRQVKFLSPKAAGLLRKRVRVKSASLRSLTIYFKQGMVRPRQDWLMTILSLIRLEVTEPIRYGSVETIVIHPGILLF